MMRIIICGILFCMGFSACCQNLIQNASFEKYLNCPRQATLFELKDVKDWYQPTNGTPDYYNACDKGENGVPRNSLGYQKAREGKGYIGMILYWASKRNVREYFSSQMTEPLEKDKLYKVRMYVSLANNSDFSISNIGVFFSDAILKKNTRRLLSTCPQLSNDFKNVINDTAHWTELSWIYKAKGNEKYICVGCFAKDSKLNLQRAPGYGSLGSLNYAYYYVDDISVCRIKDNVGSEAIDKKDSDRTKQTPDIITNIKHGNSAGMCDGYCYTESSIMHDKIITTQKAWRKGVSDTTAFPDKVDMKQITEADWIDLIRSVEMETFLNLPETIGCPDCDDGGAEWIEITCANKTHKVTFEAMKNVDGLDDLRKALRKMK